jgi:hypothetical protein
MKTNIVLFLVVALLVSCNRGQLQTDKKPSLQGTWQLVSATIVEKGDTTTTNYEGGNSMIKIINESHFAFLNHDLNKGMDSTRVFVAGGGPYTLKGDEYTEFLEYCSDRQWEGHRFQFTISVENDTLIQTGIEKVEDIGLERQNTEKYVRVKAIGTQED